MRCRMCGRRITDPGSMQKGFGPVCWEQLHPKQNPFVTEDEPEVIQIPGQMDIEDWMRDCDGEGGAEEVE